MNPKISICIPTYEMHGLGKIYLKQSFDILREQTFQDFNVIISDHSKDSEIEKLCLEYTKYFLIVYIKNTQNRGNSSANINNAIKNANGEIIKILFQDDFLYNKNSLKDIAENFDLQKDHWMVTACEHSKDIKYLFRPFYPRYNHFIHLGFNTISSPSVLSIRNKNILFFDEKLIWLMDVDYYKQCYKKFGSPKILNKINVVNRVGKHQVSNSLINGIIKIRETFYTLFKKY
jgi:glycosyltransferase involved in cell wall biosynthesis